MIYEINVITEIIIVDFLNKNLEADCDIYMEINITKQNNLDKE